MNVAERLLRVAPISSCEDGAPCKQGPTTCASRCSDSSGSSLTTGRSLCATGRRAERTSSSRCCSRGWRDRRSRIESSRARCKRTGLTGWGRAVVYIGDVRPPEIDTAGAYLWGRAGRSGGRRAAPSWVPCQRSRVRRVSGCGRSHACAHTTRVRNARRRDALGVVGVLNVAGGAYQMVRGTALAGAGLSADGPLTVPRSSRWAGTRRPQTRTARRA